MRLRVLLLSATGVLAVAGTAAADLEKGSVCRLHCHVNVADERFKPAGAGAVGSTLTARVGATIFWRLRGVGRHTVVSDKGLFASKEIGARADETFWLTPSAGRYDYHDGVGGAGAGTIIVLPTFKTLPSGEYSVTWAGEDGDTGSVYGVRWYVLAGSEIVGSGDWHEATSGFSRVFRRTERLTAGLRLSGGRSLCVEVRTGTESPRRWSEWANACLQIAGR